MSAKLTGGINAVHFYTAATENFGRLRGTLLHRRFYIESSNCVNPFYSHYYHGRFVNSDGLGKKVASQFSSLGPVEQRSLDSF